MKRAIERLEELSGTVDLLVEVIDSRAPESTRCRFVSKLIPGCRTVTVFTKSDIADDSVTEKWIEHFNESGEPAVIFPKEKHGEREKFLNRIIRAAGQGDPERGTRAAVIGLPNIGKSTTINFITGKRGAKVGARPGITRGLQLIKVRSDFLLLDTPGLVSPRIAQREENINLALVGCLQESFFDHEEAAVQLLEKSLSKYAEIYREFYGIDEATEDPMELFEAVAKRRGFLRKGGVLDLDRVYPLLIRDFSTGRISGISLESPEDFYD